MKDNTLHEGDAAFYGIDFSNEHIWRAILHDHTRSFYCLDNSYFDSTRQQYFRITKNMLQHSGVGMSDCKRFDALNIPIQPWREAGKHIVVCEQSSSFMQMPVGYEGNWLDDVLPAMRQLTSREIRVRRWARDKGHAANDLTNDLHSAHALVAWSSAALVTAVLAGVPIVAQGQTPVTPLSGSIADLEGLPMPVDRYNVAGVMADNQFTLDEMRSGYAWERLNGRA